MDTEVARSFQRLLEITLIMSLKVAAVIFVLPVFVLPALVAIVLGGSLSALYLRAQLSVKREMSRAQAPVLGHFMGVVAGLVSIRAYGAQDAFKKESYGRIDRYSRTALTYNALTQ